MIENKIKYYFK